MPARPSLPRAPPTLCGLTLEQPAVQVDFLQWKSDAGHREIAVMRRYHVQNRDDYHAYNKICGQVRRLSHLLSRLPPADPFRTKYEDMLLSKLYDMGILDRGAKMSDIEGSDAPVVKGFKGKEKEVEGAGKKEGKVTVGAMCRRRLAVVMVRLKMAETVKMVRHPSHSSIFPALD
jgi:U3 small nucleolar ribonucleoprotein protein IMP3